MPKILIGLVTHPKSTANPSLYREAIDYFSHDFQEQDWQVTITISEKNEYLQKIKLTDLWISKWANLTLVQNWIQFSGKSYNVEVRQFQSRIFFDFLKRLRAVILFSGRTICNSDFKTSEQSKYLRNLNISLSHLKIIEMSGDGSFDLTLILEDDALLNKDNLIKRDLIEFAKNSFATASQPALISFSDSLPKSKLFLTDSEGILPIFSFSGNIYLPRIMHHNTTCAVIYNHKYIESVNTVWHKFIKKIIHRGVPIDWVINALVLFQPANSLFTFHSKKNLIVQGSMQSYHRDEILD